MVIREHSNIQMHHAPASDSVIGLRCGHVQLSAARVCLPQRLPEFRVAAPAVQAVFQQLRHVALDGFELIQMQLGIGDGENVAGLGMLINKHALAVALTAPSL